MSAEMKYVVVETDGIGEQLFVFPKNVDHDAFADVLSHIKQGGHGDWSRVYRRPISAGFTDGIKCYGRSESLNLDSRKLDAGLLFNGGKT